jgi:hypothetical protein
MWSCKKPIDQTPGSKVDVVKQGFLSFSSWSPCRRREAHRRSCRPTSKSRCCGRCSCWRCRGSAPQRSRRALETLKPGSRHLGLRPSNSEQCEAPIPSKTLLGASWLNCSRRARIVRNRRALRTEEHHEAFTHRHYRVNLGSDSTHPMSPGGRAVRPLAGSWRAFGRLGPWATTAGSAARIL